MIFQVLRLTSNLISVLVYLLVAFLLSAKLALLSLLGAALLFWIGLKKNKHAYDLGKAGQRSNKKVYQVVLEHLSGMKIAKSFAEEDKYIGEFIFHSEELEKRRLDYARLSARTSLMYSVGSVILLSFYVFLGLKMVHLPASTLLVMIYIFSRLLPKVSMLQTSYQSILQLLPAFSVVNEFQAACDAHREELVRQDVHPIDLKEGLEIRNLTFSYELQPVFEHLSFTIPVNSVFCITGKSGKGKTTLADLILGLLRPSEGEILIDGKTLDKDVLFRWRKSIGYVAQESFLFNDTIRNNLLWTKPGATEKELWEALNKSSADEMVKKFPLGLETLVGDRGARLSGGERQRLALARALVRKPMLLILDEATNSLDPVNENKILDALNGIKGSTTMLIISHHPEMKRIADRVINFD